jgi:hypothetical protein
MTRCVSVCVLVSFVACGGKAKKPIAVELEPTTDPSSMSARCSLVGDPAPEQKNAILEFAKTQLLDEIGTLTGHPSKGMPIETPAEPFKCVQGAHADGTFAEVVITPRSVTGELIVSQREVDKGDCTWGAQVVYCLNVIDTPTGTSIRVQKIAERIGHSSPARARSILTAASVRR